MATKIIDFPRGGEQPKLPQRKRKRNERENIFKISEDEPTTKRKKSKKIKSDKTKSSTPVTPLIVERRRIPGWIHLKNVSEDTIVLGVVKEIQDVVVLVSLPYNLIGRIDVTDVSAVFSQNVLEDECNKSLQNIFHTGQFIVCRIKQIGRSSLGLTCDPAIVNRRVSSSAIQTGLVISGVVTSREDHGYQISFGVEGVVGFLLNKRAKAYIQTHNEGQLLSVGQVLLCCVEGGGTRAVPVSIDLESIKNASPPPPSSFDNTLPFQSVKCKVTQVQDNSLALDVPGGFSASCAHPHLKRVSDGLEGYNQRSVKGRVIWIRQEEKQIGVSLKKSLLEAESSALDGFEVGDTFSEAEVVRSERRGLFLKLTEGLTGYCPLHNISDEFVSKPDKSHRSGTTHKCRVVSYNSLDGSLLVSLRESVIEEKFLNFQFVKVGDVVQGKIVSKSDKGLVVSLSPHVKGFCPKGHYSERNSQSKSKQKRLQEGCEDTFRVLRIEPRQKLTLTHKRGLVRSSRPVLSEYSAAVVGQTYHGYVSGVREFGCVVRFYQQVRGILHRSRLQLMPQQSVSDLFWEGQVLECSVSSCVPAEQKLELAIATDSVQENADSLENFSQVCLCVGGISPAGLELLERGTKERAFLPLSHLSDYRELQELRYRSLEKQLETDDQLELSGLRVYTQSSSSSVCVVSLKESIARDIAGGVVVETGALETGLLAHGVVRRVEKYGYLVGYPGGATGLLPNRYIRDAFVDSLLGILEPGDTVLTRVMEVEEGRFVVSSRDSDVISNEAPDREGLGSLGDWFLSYLSTRDALLREVSGVESHRTPGHIVDCTLLEKGPGGTIVSLGGGGSATAVGVEATELEEGDTHRACVLGISICPNNLYVSLNTDLVESYSTPDWSAAELGVGSCAEVRVQLVLPRHMVGLVGTLRGPRLVYIIRGAAVSTKSSQTILEQYLNKRVSVLILDRDVYSSSVVLGLLTEGSQLSASQKRQLGREQDSISIGSTVTAQVREVHCLMLKVKVGAYSGRIHAIELSDNPVEGEFPTKAFKKGDTLRARILAKREKQTGALLKRGYTVLDLSLRSSEQTGDKYHGCVAEIWPGSNLVVRVGAKLSLYVPLLLCSQNMKVLRNLEAHFKLGQVVSVELVRTQKGKKSTGTLVERSQLTAGDTTAVQIKQIFPNQGLLVTLPSGGTGRVDVTDLSDSYSKDTTGPYAEKQLLQAKVIAMEEQSVILSTRDSVVSEFLISEPVAKDRVIASVHDLTKGEVLRGFVKSATDVGVFVKLSRSLTGRVRIKNMSDQFIREFKDRFPVGKLVKCKVLTIDSENGYVDLSLRLSHTNPEKFAALCAEKGKPDKNKKINKMKECRLNNSVEQNESGEENISEITKVRNIFENNNNQSSSEEDLLTEMDLQEMQSLPLGTQTLSNKRRHAGSLPRLDGIGGLKWDWEMAQSQEKEQISDSEKSQEEEAPAKKKTKRQKRAVKRKEEESIYRAEQSLLDPNRQPDSSADFDRLLLANPNSSYLWIQYMAYQLHLADVEGARGVGRRALESINFRLEEEKLNVWVSLLNLENIYGTPDTLVCLFQEALRENDTETLHFKLAQIYINSDKLELAAGTYRVMTRKYGANPRVWKELGQLLMQSGKTEEARKICENALQKLPERFHVEILSKFGQFEFKFGEFERGRTIFETLLSNHPKRTDIWFVYIDTLTKYDSPDHVRSVYERGTHLNLSVNKMKAFYKKYLSFEQSNGSAEDMERVMENAREFVQSKLGLGTETV